MPFPYCPGTAIHGRWFTIKNPVIAGFSVLGDVCFLVDSCRSVILNPVLARKARLNGAAESTPAHFQAVADFPCAASLSNPQHWLGELIKKIDKGGYMELQDDSTYLVYGSTGPLCFFAIKREQST